MSLELATIHARLAAATSWEAKNRLLVQLARELPEFAQSNRLDSNRVAGCESQVWLICSWQGSQLQLVADSDSRVIKGLLALVIAAYQDKTVEEIRDFNFENWLIELGLNRFLSTSRGNGLRSIVQRIREAGIPPDA